MSDKFKIEVKFEPNKGPTKTRSFEKNQVISFGRSDDNSISVPFDFVSRYHGAFYCVNQTWRYEDFSSLGSFLERSGKRTPFRNRRIEIFKGDKIIVEFNQGKGSYTFRYTLTVKNL
tara:strand:- start:8906 stop:9256 length:351 start_codon:yes stop_codon:yes gene_type:complete